MRESLRCDDGILRCELVLSSLSQSSTYPSRRSGLRCGGTDRGEHASGVTIGHGQGSRLLVVRWSTAWGVHYCVVGGGSLEAIVFREDTHDWHVHYLCTLPRLRG